MELLTAAVFVEDNGQTRVVMHDALRMEGELWLVAGWRHNEAEGWRTPTRLIRIASEDYQETDPAVAYFRTQVLVSLAIPKSVLDGHATHSSLALFEVQEAPGIRMPVPSMH